MQFSLTLSGFSKETRSDFDFQSRSVLALFARCFSRPGFIDKKLWKIEVDLTNGEARPSVLSVGDVLSIQIKTDVNSFFQLEAVTKASKILEYLMAGLMKLSALQGWDISPFRIAYDEVINLNFVNHWLWKKPVLNKMRSMSAEVWIEHELSVVKIFVLIKDQAKTIVKKIHLIDEMPHELIFYKHLGKLQWENDSTVELLCRDFSFNQKSLKCSV
jgi:hypothetical protein